MFTTSREREARKGSNETPVPSRPSPESAKSGPGDTASSILDLQQSHGNRYVQRMLTGDARAAVGEEENEESQTATASVQAPAVHFPAAALAYSGKPTVIEVQLEPHRGTVAELRALAPFYRAGRTPYFDTDGTLRTFEVAPADAAKTAHQLGTIHQRFGNDGVAQTIRGLTLTRGAPFASQVLRRTSSSVAEGAGAATVDETATERMDPISARAGTVDAPGQGRGATPGSTGEPLAWRAGSLGRPGKGVSRILDHSGSGTSVPRGIRRQVSRLTGDPLTDVRVHHDSAAHTAADLLNARAFTIGRSIYFAPGEWRPDSASGRRLLAHELAHTVQQRGAELPSLEDLRVSSSSDIEESHADHVADAMTGGGQLRTRVARAGGRRFARVQRAISFTRDNDVFTQNSLQVDESAGGFTIRRNTAPLFGWFADVTISGNAGDPFANFEAGPHQVVRAFRGEFTWGTGGSRARRVLTVSTLPIRDATAAGNTWYHDPFAVAYAANGDSHNTGLNDSPSPGTQPWVSPVAGKGGATGSLAFTAAFVAYISARDTTQGTGAAAFTALNSVYWNSGISGSFDTGQAVGSRVTASGGRVNRGGIISGGSGEFPSMHGGGIANNSFTTTDT